MGPCRDGWDTSRKMGAQIFFLEQASQDLALISSGNEGCFLIYIFACNCILYFFKNYFKEDSLKNGKNPQATNLRKEPKSLLFG
jgi:hypothetical protein